MAKFLQRVVVNLTHLVSRRRPASPNPALALAHSFTGDFGFLDEQTNKSHQLSVSPDLAIKIDGRTLQGQVTGITTEQLTFLDHFGYQLIITSGANGPETVYDEAEDTTYRILTAITTPLAPGGN